MWNAYVAASALLYAILAVMHLVRIINRWSVVIGPNNVAMSVSWVALVVSGLLSIWGFAQLSLGLRQQRERKRPDLSIATNCQARDKSDGLKRARARGPSALSEHRLAYAPTR